MTIEVMEENRNGNKVTLAVHVKAEGSTEKISTELTAILDSFEEHSPEILTDALEKFLSKRGI